MAAALVLFVTAGFGFWLAQPDGPTRIAVLPFATADGDGHFGAGVAEELMNTLVGLPGLRVTSRTTAFADHGATDPKLIGESLAVDALLIGNLRRSENGIRLSAQLVDVASGDHLWADTFEGPNSSLYTMQDQVISSVTTTLGIALDQPLQVARTTTDINALDLYLLGRHHWHQRTPEGLERAVTYFLQAIATDPEMSQAYSGLADAYLLQSNYDDLDQALAIELAEPLIEQALILDPASADAHASRGILLEKQGDYRAAERSLAQAVALNPNHSMAHMWRGNAVMALGHLQDAFGHYQDAFGLDPLHRAVTHNYINTLIELGHYDEARIILNDRSADQFMTRMAGQLAMERGDWGEVERLAAIMTEDPVGAALLRWRLEVKRQNFTAAENRLAVIARESPDDERVYLAALEHYTLTADAMEFHGVINHWNDRGNVPNKVDLMARAWIAIGQVSRGDKNKGIQALFEVLKEFNESYPPFQMKLMSHLLVALAETGQTSAYEQWREDALQAVDQYTRSGWGSYEFQIERGYLLAAAGMIAEALESFRAAGPNRRPFTSRAAGGSAIYRPEYVNGAQQLHLIPNRFTTGS